MNTIHKRTISIKRFCNTNFAWVYAKEILRRKILQKAFSPGDRSPSLAELAITGAAAAPSTVAPAGGNIGMAEEYLPKTKRNICGRRDNLASS